MNERAAELRRLLVRNLDEVTLERQQREPLYDTRCGGVSDGTAARCSVPATTCSRRASAAALYHLHHAQEEMFVILEGEGTLRVAGEIMPVRAGDVVFIPPGPEYPHQFINTSDAPMRYLGISTQEQAGTLRVPGFGQGGRLHPRPAHHPAPGRGAGLLGRSREPTEPLSAARAREPLAQPAHRARADAGAEALGQAFGHVLVRRVVDDVLGLDHLARDEIGLPVLSARPSLTASSPFQNRPEKVSGVSFRRWPRPRFTTAMNCWWIWSIIALAWRPCASRSAARTDRACPCSRRR